MKRLLCLLSFILLGSATTVAQIADTVYYNGRVITLWSAHPVVEAFAVRGNCFLKVGSNDEVMKTGGPHTHKVDLHGHGVTPGLIDSHVHPIMAAMAEKYGPVPVIRSIADIQAYIRSQVASTPPGHIIYVPKVYSTRLKERRYPTRYDLDEAASDRLVIVDNQYAGVLDSALLAKMHITRDTPQPGDGKIIKDDRGEPTGLILGAPELLDTLRRPPPHS